MSIHISILALPYGSLVACSFVMALGNCSVRLSFSKSPLLRFSSVSESDILRSVLSERADSLLGRRSCSRVLLLTSLDFSLSSFRASIAGASREDGRTRKQREEAGLRIVYGILPDMNWLTADCMSDELHDEAISCIRVDLSVELRNTFLAFQLLAGLAGRSWPRCPLDKSLTTCCT